jgi:acylpyruvate hydrolase
MRLLSFDVNGQPRAGVRIGQEVVDLAEAAPRLPRDLLGIIQAGPAAFEEARRAAEAAKTRLPLERVRHLIPVPRPDKIVGIGMNFFKHAAEMGAKDLPTFPGMYLRCPGSLLAHNEAILRPHQSETLDYEGELLVVIGKTGRYIPEDKALEHVAGYSLFNDATIREFALKPLAVVAGKNFDRTGAFGPEIVTTDELPPGAHGLRLQTRLNGQTVQDDNTSDMFWGVAKAIALISTLMELKAGDILATGTPSGVGISRTPPLWMKHGDRVEVEIEGIGVLANSVEDDSRR